MQRGQVNLIGVGPLPFDTRSGAHFEPRPASLRAVVAYPGVMPAANQVALAFLEAGLLARYETTFAYLRSGWSRVLGAAGALGARVDKQLARRELNSIPPHLVRSAPLFEFIRTAAGLAGADEVVTDRLWEHMIMRFDAGVAKRIGTGANIVYGYEHACRETFRRAGELGVRRVFDLASPHYSAIETMLATQMERFPELVSAYWTQTRQLSSRRNARKQAELDAADLVIANSAFTARTLSATGYPASRVRVVPLGAPPVDPSWRFTAADSRVRFLYAGPVSVRKGAHHLIDAWRSLSARRDCELTFAGQWLLPDHMAHGLPAGTRVLGSVQQRELFDLYRTSSLLVFPSLMDGFGMVVTEALAHGLPVITTRSVGAADIVQEGINGWVLEPGDSQALAERLAWCLEHPRELRAMREAAEATAAANQWNDYRRRLIRTVHDFFASSGDGHPSRQ